MCKKIMKIWGLVCCLFLASCSEWLTVQPAEMLMKDEMFLTESGFHDALMGVYVLMQEEYGLDKPLTTGFVEHLACQWEVAKNSADEDATLHNYTELDSQLANIFKALYKALVNANLLLEHIEKQDGILTEKQYNEYKGQVLAIRSFLHFDLMRLWGPMPGRVTQSRKYLPYVTKMQIDFNEYFTYEEYMNKLLVDLETAEKCLKQNSVAGNINKSLFNYYAVFAMKSRFYLWMGDKEKAAEYANRLIDHENKAWKLGDYKSIESEDVQFKSEHILYLSFGTKDVTENYKFYNTSTYVTDELFEGSGTDIRLFQWKDRSQDDTKEPTKTVIKYSYTDAPKDTEGRLPLIRLAEMYLIAMECCDLERTNTLYQQFCEARGIAYAPLTEINRLERLLKEYRLEFVSEGQLFYAYKRWGVVNMPRCKNVCGPSAYVLPLPLKETDINR